MLDVVIKGGTVVDGTNAAPRTADLGLKDGKIVEMGSVSTPARQEIDAEGAIVAPGWIDVHTHYDGQVTWDDEIAPSFQHGVTTAIMGNCGVGFAPVRPGGEKVLIELMEGVEDIPGTALYDGIPWGEWETFEGYLDFLESRNYALDIGAQLPHGALRSYVMGSRSSLEAHANAEDVEEMGRHIERAMKAGAMGFSTSRTLGHRSLSGEPVPGTLAAEVEILAFAEAMKRAGRGVFEVIPSNVIGELEMFGGEKRSTFEEIKLMGDFSRESGRKVTFTQLQIAEAPERWKLAFEATDLENKNGAQLYPQVSGRGVGMLTSFRTYHMFMRRETFLKLADLPQHELIAELKKPEVRAKILADKNIPHPDAGSMKNIYGHYERNLHQIFELRHFADYEPEADRSIAEIAKREKHEPQEVMYDALLKNDGTAFCVLLGSNYYQYSLDPLREMITHPKSVSGLGDAGAHVNFIADGSMPSFSMIHWVRDRTRGEKLPIELIVHKQTGANADLYGLHDRGVLAEGKRADINILDLNAMQLKEPELHYDLPGGGSRIIQDVDGYVATFVNGIQTRSHGEDTGARPGSLVRGKH
ncbi:MAG: amidohydrolase family protein [Henriciella sp.]